MSWQQQPEHKATSPRLHVHEGVLRRLLGLPAVPWEVGGWLLGYRTGDRADLVVTHATPPAHRGTPLGVRISGEGHRQRFDAVWASSRGMVTFLGDWHTHPGGPPAPSARDEAAVAQLARRPHFHTPEPLMAIATHPRWRHGRGARAIAFFLRASNGSIVPLEVSRFTVLPPQAAGPDVWSGDGRSAVSHPITSRTLSFANVTKRRSA